MDVSGFTESIVMQQLTDFLDWWRGELVKLVPAFIKRFFQAESLQLQLHVTTGAASITRGSDGEILQSVVLNPDATTLPDKLLSILSGLNQSNIETVLFLAPEDTLVLELMLPSESEADIRDVLGYEMDRQTPFTLDQVYFDFQIGRPSAKQNKIQVKALVAPRDRMDAWLERVVLWGQRASVVTVDQAQDQAGTGDTGFNLLPKDRRPHKKLGLRKLNYALAASAIILAVMIVVLTLYRQVQQIDALNAQIADVKEDVQKVQGLRTDMDRLMQEAAQLIERKQQSPKVVEVLNELSLVIPDHTWIHRFQLNEGRITLQGESSNASELIGLIETSDKFQDATFASPVVRDQKSQQDRFQITANLVTQGGV